MVRVIYVERSAYNFDGVGPSRIAMSGQPNYPKRAAAYLLVFDELKFLDRLESIFWNYVYHGKFCLNNKFRLFFMEFFRTGASSHQN